MKALTLYQPHATAMALGIKTIETRGWSTSYRGPVVIHSAQKCTREMNAAFVKHLNIYTPDRADFAAAGYRFFSELPFGQTLAVADLVDVVPVEQAFVRTPEYLGSYEEGRVEFRGARERRWGDYAPGRFAWIFANLRRLDRPRHVSGAQGLWEYKHGAIEVPAPVAA